MPDRYAIRSDYAARQQPEYFTDDLGGTISQPDVYAEAARVARRLGAGTIIDAGCGNGDKLVALAGEFKTIGIDYGSNIEHCRRTHPGQWFEGGLTAPGDLSVPPDLLLEGVIVCADVMST